MGDSEKVWHRVDKAFERDDENFAKATFYKEVSSSGIMHSKFVIFDHLEFADDADVPRSTRSGWTGWSS